MSTKAKPAAKPTYLGLLNTISLAESRAYQVLSAWAAVTDNPDVRRVISTVAIREGEHGMAFTKRLNELGFSVLDRPDPSFEAKLTCAQSNCSDVEKFEALGLGRSGDAGDSDRPDALDGLFHDRTIDPQTGALLGRWIAEERDSARLLGRCYRALRSGKSPATSGVTA
jgi:hypothetical protein